MAQLSDRIKGKSIALFKCDNCSIEFYGNYYKLKPKEMHLCRSCSCKNGWEDKYKKDGNFITNDQKSCIVYRYDNKSLDEHFPKNQKGKLRIYCIDCGSEYDTNNFNFIEKYPNNRCISCSQKYKWSTDYDRLCAVRRTDDYRNNMSKAIKNSDKRNEEMYKKIGRKHVEYWAKERGFTKEELWDEWTLYRKTVYNMSEKVYRKHKKQINPNNLPRSRKEYHIDHIFSVLEGFKRNIPPYIISDLCNLRMLYGCINLSKRDKCDITEDELMNKYFNKRRSL